MQDLKKNTQVKNAERQGKRQRIEEMTKFLNEQTGELQEFDEQLVRRLIEKRTFFHDKLTVYFKSSVEIGIKIKVYGGFNSTINN